MQECENENFTARPCPLCGNKDGRLLFNLEAGQFCSVNSTYRLDFRKVLHLKEEIYFPIDHCNVCGFIYSRWLPSKDFLAKLYDEVIIGGECIEGSENINSYSIRMRYLSELVRFLPPARYPRILDYGCGLGISLRLLQAVNVEAIGFDPSSVRTNYNIGKNLYVINDASQIEGMAPFDAIICDNVLEHIPSPRNALRRFRELLKPSGIVFLSVPNYEDKFVRRMVKLIDSGGQIDMSLNPWEHLNYFNLLTIDKMMLSEGFRPVTDSELTAPVNIGLRPDARLINRLKNGLPSFFRFLKYIACGQGARNVNNLFYRLESVNN